MMLQKTIGYTEQLLTQQMNDKVQTADTLINTQVENSKKTSTLLAEQFALHPEVIKGVTEGNKAMVHAALKDSTVVAREKAGIDLVWVTQLAARTPNGNTPILACPSNPSFDGFPNLHYASTNEALHTGKTVVSWEVNGEDGKLQVSAPIKDAKGKVIGAVVVGQQTYQPLLKRISDRSDTAMSIFLKNGKDFYIMTDTQKDEIGRKLFKDSHDKYAKDVKQAKNMAELASTNSDYKTILSFLNQVADKKDFTETILLQGKPYVCNFTPLTTYNGEVIGVLVSRFPGLLNTKEMIMSQTSTMRILSYTVTICVVVVSLIASIFFSRSITNPIQQMVQSVDQIARGDLTRKIDVRSKDEVGQLAEYLRAMTESLKKVIQEVSSAAHHVSASSHQLQANIEKTTKAAHQITMSVQHVAQVAENQQQQAEKSTAAIQVMNKKKMSSRNYVCSCGYQEHRDVHGARNILSKAIHEEIRHFDMPTKQKYLRIA